jgi:hypothetical protein
VTAFIRRLITESRAQDGFEYLLATGIIVVILAVAFFAFTDLVPDFVGNACPSIDSAATPQAANGSCIDTSP